MIMNLSVCLVILVVSKFLCGHGFALTGLPRVDLKKGRNRPRAHSLGETHVVKFPPFATLDQRPNIGTLSSNFEAKGQSWRLVMYPGGNEAKGRVGFFLRFVVSPHPA